MLSMFAGYVLVPSDTEEPHVEEIVSFTETEKGLKSLEANSFDFIFSLMSWGFHYPLDTYSAEVFRLLRPGGFLLLDSRLKDATPLEKVGFICNNDVARKASRVRCTKS